MGRCAHLQGPLPGEHDVLGAGELAGDRVGAREAVGAGAEEHVDHDMVEVGGGPGDPLAHDEQAEVAEEAVEEDHLGDELAVGGQAVPEVALVQVGQHYAAVHLDHACARAVVRVKMSHNGQNHAPQCGSAGVTRPVHALGLRGGSNVSSGVHTI